MGDELVVLDPRVPRRVCASDRNGEACRAAPLRDSLFCFWHDPATAEEAADARRLGGLRRRRQTLVAAGYEVTSLDNVAGIRRVLEIAVLDVLPMENSIARARVLIAAAATAAKLIEVERQPVRSDPAGNQVLP